MDQREFVKEAITKIINDNKLDEDVKYLNCAIVLLMFSSGLQFKEVKNLKLKDFEESCKYIENYGSMDSFIKRDPIKEKIIPIWDLSDEKKEKIRIVCSSPEATYFIFQYLHKKRKKLNSKDSLFVGKNGKKLHDYYPSKNILTYDFRTEILKDSNEDVSKFKPSKLSKYLIDLLGHESFNMGKLFEGTTAKKPKDTYKKIKNDESNILDYYKKVLPYIKIDINAILKDNTSKDIVTKTNFSEEEYTQKLYEYLSPNNLDDDKFKYMKDKLDEKLKAPDKDNVIKNLVKFFKKTELDWLFETYPEKKKLKEYYEDNYSKSYTDFDKYFYMINKVNEIIISQEHNGKDTNNLFKFFKMAEVSWLFDNYSEKILIEYNFNDDENKLMGEIFDILYQVGIRSGYVASEFRELFLKRLSEEFEYTDCAIITLSTIKDAFVQYIELHYQSRIQRPLNLPYQKDNSN